jgi:hypothetical protein
MYAPPFETAFRGNGYGTNNIPTAMLFYKYVLV